MNEETMIPDTPVDAEKDKYWLEKAAEKKDEKAMAIMGIE